MELDMLGDRTQGSVKVLVLDDEEDFLELCREFFSREDGVQADYITSPTKALEMLETTGYDVVVSDHTLPGMNGLEFLKALRSLQTGLPFILITGRGREGLALEALQSGADFYMEKAGEPRSLFAQLLSTVRTLAVDSARAAECLVEPFQVFSQSRIYLVSNGGERVMAASSR